MLPTQGVAGSVPDQGTKSPHVSYGMAKKIKINKIRMIK